MLVWPSGWWGGECSDWIVVRASLGAGVGRGGLKEGRGGATLKVRASLSLE